MIGKLLEPFGFSFGQLQDIATMLTGLNKDNVTIKDFKLFIDKKKQAMAITIKEQQEENAKELEAWKAKAIKCVKCGAPLSLFPVNTVPGDQTGDDSRSMWMCAKCWETTYNLETVADILRGMK